MLNSQIQIVDRNRKTHAKASEEYLHVIFTYEDSQWEGWIPVVYRRTGISIHTDDDLIEYLNKVYEQMHPRHQEKWDKEQKNFWNEKANATVTKSFFDALSDGNWKCRNCDLPTNPNFARRIQDLKEFGYTIATDTNRTCGKCGENTTHLMLLRIPRGNIQGNGYETFPPALRRRILTTLNFIDCYEDCHNPHCLPDHKFPEIRWGQSTKSINSKTMSEADIRLKFQLLTNQRNQQKREVCRSCFQTGKRGMIFGIPYYYEGSSEWDPNIPTTGKEAEQGCVGCPWYDIHAWRTHLINKLFPKNNS